MLLTLLQWNRTTFAVEPDANRPAAVLPALVEGVPRGELFERHLRSIANQHLAKRQREFSAIRTLDELQEWQRIRREFLLRQLGPFPPRTPLNVQVTGRLRGDGFHVEKILWESRPGLHCTAAYYLPEGQHRSGSLPAVIVPCGHSLNGKGAEAYQRICQLLARNGIAAVCYDPLGQGERYQVLPRDGWPLIGPAKKLSADLKKFGELSPGAQPQFGTTEEHTLMGIGAILLGANMAREHIWDGMRALDFLESREEVDRTRLGCTGNSGGGTLTSYLMALDDRISVAAPSCYITSFERLLETIGPQDAEQNIFGQIEAGVNHADYLLLRAPRPTLICAATQDFFDISGTWTAFRDAKRGFGRFGFPERVELAEADAKHGFSAELRVAATRWMRRWLLSKDDAISETLQPVFSDAEMQASPTGQVLLLPRERSIFEFHREEADELAKSRRSKWAGAPLEEKRQIVLKRLKLTNEKLKPSARFESETANSRVLKLENGQPLPVRIVQPAANRPHQKTVVILYSEGMPSFASTVENDSRRKWIESLQNDGTVILLADLSGLGELKATARKEDWATGIFGPNLREFFLAYLNGESLVSIRTMEVQQLLFAVKAEFNTPIELITVGSATAIPALHAVALESTLVSKLTATKCLESWEKVLEELLPRDQLENTVHGVLHDYDLPDLRSMIPNGRLLFTGPVNGRGELLTPRN